MLYYMNMEKINLTVPEIFENLKRAGYICHIDNLYKIKRLESFPSRALAKELEKICGIPRLKLLYPDEYGNPW